MRPIAIRCMPFDPNKYKSRHALCACGKEQNSAKITSEKILTAMSTSSVLEGQIEPVAIVGMGKTLCSV